MSVIGRVERLWRYPVKSMRGEELETAHVTFSGIYGDRVFAFRNSAAPETFPYLTARTQKTMLQYVPHVQDAGGKVTVAVQTPAGDILTLDDPALIHRLGDGLRDASILTLLRSDRAMMDCHPVSLISLQTVRQIGEELGLDLDLRRFRANIYLDLAGRDGFGEDALVGRRLRLGPTVVLEVLERDQRCRMISLDPDTGESNPDILQKVAHDHEGRAGVYAAVLVEGAVNTGATVTILD
ncbi:MAG: MOSC domain-containing protein [Armatimonadota bacterium]